MSALGSQGRALVDRVRKERAELEARKQAAARSTARAARKLAKAGLSVRDVGEVLGLSHQRVQQLLERSDAA